MGKETAPVRVIPTEEYFSLIRRQLAENGHAYVRVTGSSMRPLLRHLRDGVIIVPPDKVRRGDVVLFDRLNGRYALHRVIRVRKNGFTMAGDSQWHVENGLPYEQIVGVAAWIDRGGKMMPFDGFFLKILSFALTSLALPRIYLWKAVNRLAKPFRRQRKHGKGADL